MGAAEIERSVAIAGVVVVRPAVARDDRGRFAETFRTEWVPEAPPFVQHNRADRRAGCLVGLHYHRRQADYWTLQRGRVVVGLHDLRRQSPTHGANLLFEIDESDFTGVYIPAGVAHGFYAPVDVTLAYAVDRTYDPADELGVAWDDPDVGLAWPLDAPPILSERDRTNPRLRALDPALRPD